VLNWIGISKNTIDDVILRTRDVVDEVRRHAFRVIGSKVALEKLTIAQRINLLKDGLSDRSDAVRECCVDMLCNIWYKRVKDDPIKVRVNIA
jgi:condensin complex subunit 3